MKISKSRVADLHGEMVTLDRVKYMPMGYKVRWRAIAKTSTNEHLEFWMFGEHARMIHAAGFGSVPKQAGEHHFHGLTVLIEIDPVGNRGIRMQGVVKDGSLIGDPRAERV